MPIDQIFGSGPINSQSSINEQGPSTDTLPSTLVVGYYQLAGMFILRPYCTPLAYIDGNGTMNPYGIMPYDKFWDVVEKWCKEETRWPKGLVDRENNKVFFHRKSEAMMFKLHFG